MQAERQYKAGDFVHYSTPIERTPAHTPERTPSPRPHTRTAPHEFRLHPEITAQQRIERTPAHTPAHTPGAQ